MEEVLTRALTRMPEPIVWEEEVPPKGKSAPINEDEPAGIVAH
jgi:hypothetical protein